MALSKTQIANQIGSLIDGTDLSLEEAKTKFKNDLAEIIVNAIKSARITIPSNTIVTVGSQTTQQNISTIIIDNGIS